MKKNYFRFLSISLALSFGGLLLLTSCLDNDPPTPVEVAHVSIYHGSPNTEGLDIFVNSTGQINDLPFEYEDYYSYINFFPGNRNLRFIDASNGISTLLDTTFTFVVNEAYSIFIADSLSSIEAVILNDSFPEAVSGKAMVRFVHLSPDTESIDLSVDDENLFTGHEFANGSDFVPVDIGPVTFEFRTTGGQDVVLSNPNVELQNGEYYTVVLNGFSNPPSGNTHGISSDIIKL